MSAESPAVGDRLRVVEQAADGSTRVVTKGTVVAVDAANNRIDFGTAKTKLTSTANVKVTIEQVLPDLPTTPGSVLRTPAGPSSWLLTYTGWIGEDGSKIGVARLQQLGATVLFDAGA